MPVSQLLLTVSIQSSVKKRMTSIASITTDCFHYWRATKISLKLLKVAANFHLISNETANIHKISEGFLNKPHKCEIWGSHSGDYEKYYVLVCDVM
jgi:hypothetical protein